MKKLITFGLSVIALAFTATGMAQEFSGLDKSPLDIAAYPASYKISDKLVKVTYSRPQLKGRTVSELTPQGKVWRTGANEATQITFYKDAVIAGQNIPAGTYSLFTIPGEKEWTVILNSELNQWGAYSYDQSKDIARLPAQATKGAEDLEAFSIAFTQEGTGARMFMGWGILRVALPINFN